MSTYMRMYVISNSYVQRFPLNRIIIMGNISILTLLVDQ